MIRLRISEQEKYANDGEWFKEYMKQTIPTILPEIEDYQTMITNYRVANGDLTDFKDLMNQFCNPLGEVVGEVDEEVQPYPELHNTIGILKGEVIQRKDDLRLSLFRNVLFPS